MEQVKTRNRSIFPLTLFGLIIIIALFSYLSLVDFPAVSISNVSNNNVQKTTITYNEELVEIPSTATGGDWVEIDSDIYFAGQAQNLNNAEWIPVDFSGFNMPDGPRDKDGNLVCKILREIFGKSCTMEIYKTLVDGKPFFRILVKIGDEVILEAQTALVKTAEMGVKTKFTEAWISTVKVPQYLWRLGFGRWGFQLISEVIRQSGTGVMDRLLIDSAGWVPRLLHSLGLKAIPLGNDLYHLVVH